MKAVFRITLLIASLGLVFASNLQAQRMISGTVYRNGEPAAGINVEAHRGSSMMTSFDGKYKVEADEKTKWIKFTYINESKRLDIEDKKGDVFDFPFEGDLPSAGAGEAEGESSDVILKSIKELIQDQDRDFMNEWSLYDQFYKQENFKSALPHWRKIYSKYPKSTLNIYIHGANMFEKFIEKSDSPEKKNENINELMKIYDKRVKYFNEKGFVLGRKATAWLKYKLENGRELENGELKETLTKGYDWTNESIAEGGSKTELPVLVLFMQTSRSLFKLGEIPKETVVKNYDICNNLLNTIQAETEDESKLSDIEKVKVAIEEIFSKSGAADCEALVNIFTPQFDENKDDIDFIKNMLRRLGDANCDETPLFSDATERLYELDPSAEAAYNMARRNVKSDDIERAKKYYQQAMEQETDKELLAKYYYEYGLFIFAKEHALQEARSYARKALDIKSNYCEALMLIGEIYVAASHSFGGDDFEKASVFWLVVDYFERARSNPDCAVDASAKIRDYRKYFPNKEEAFFRSLQEGKTYKVGGWINESTKVRF